MGFSFIKRTEFCLWVSLSEMCNLFQRRKAMEILSFNFISQVRRNANWYGSIYEFGLVTSKRDECVKQRWKLWLRSSNHLLLMYCLRKCSDLHRLKTSSTVLFLAYWLTQIVSIILQFQPSKMEKILSVPVRFRKILLHTHTHILKSSLLNSNKFNLN